MKQVVLTEGGCWADETGVFRPGEADPLAIVSKILVFCSSF